jgi:hypothetical protein
MQKYLSSNNIIMEVDVGTYDMNIYNQSMGGSGKESTPFTRKELIAIVDNNSTNYTTGSITFETNQLANCGKYCDYANAYIAIPMVFTLTGTDFSTATDTDLAIALKGSNYQFIHSYRVEYDNVPVVNNFDFANALIEFDLHSTSCLDDEKVNGETIGYVKNKSTGWGYKSTASLNGLGIYNNDNIGTIDTMLNSGEANTSILERQRKFINNSSRNKVAVREDDQIKKTGKNYIINAVAHKTYYYNCIIKLKDLLFTKNLPLIKGAMLKLVFNMNIGSFLFARTATAGVAGGLLNITPTTIHMTGGGGTNPLMVTSIGYSVPTTTTLNAITAGAQIVQCGSSQLPVNVANYKVSFAIVKNHFDTIATQEAHQEAQCRLIVPVYTMYSAYEKNYLDQMTKRIMYKGIQYKGILNNPSSSFSQLLTGGVVNPTRLVVVPMLSASANQQMSPCLSPFTCEPSYCSPYSIQNFNCQLAGVSIYSQSFAYDYEQFLIELDGHDSITNNLERGMTSSRISLTDYSNTYGYLVVDLKRRLPTQDNTPVSIGISGTITSPLALDFHCFIEYEKEVTIDLYTGKIVST